MSEPFKTFLSQLSKTNATLNYFTDFKKIQENVDKISIKLNQLNYLIGKENLKLAIEALFEENPKTFEVLNILIAKRDSRNTFTLNNSGTIVTLDTFFSKPELILDFINETGLAEIFRDSKITNLVDYVFGIEVGLDSNTRKNRGGKTMSKDISLIFNKAGIYYKQEININIFPEINNFGIDKKKFDFVIKTKSKIYLIEANYYNTQGSKPNEIARAYANVASKINNFNGFEFVWITDGQGWLSSKNQLEQAYNVIPSLYNLTTINAFISKIQNESITRDW